LATSEVDRRIKWLCDPDSLTDGCLITGIEIARCRQSSSTTRSLALRALEVYASNPRITGDAAVYALHLIQGVQVQEDDAGRASRVLLAVLKRAHADKSTDVLRATLRMYRYLIYVDLETWVQTIDAIGRLLQDDDLFATNDYVGTDDVYTLAIAALDVLVRERQPLYSTCSLAGHRLFVKTMVAVLTKAHQKRPDSWWKIPAVQHAVLVAPMHLAEVFEAVCVLAEDARPFSSTDAGKWFTNAVVHILEQLAYEQDEPFVHTLRNRPWLVQATGTTWEGNSWGVSVHTTIRRYNELVPDSPLPECAEASALKELFDKELAEALAVAQRCASKADARRKRVWYTVVSACALGVACFILR
jgi:hypothetical protein